MYKLFGSEFSHSLKETAAASHRKRAHHNIHRSYNDPVQSIVISLFNGTYIPPHFHRHTHQKELFVLLRGSVKFIFFNDAGCIMGVTILSAGEMIEILPSTIHSVVALSAEALVLEVKQGPFVADDCKVFPKWTIPEDDPLAVGYVAWLESAGVGDQYEPHQLKTECEATQ